MKPTFSVHKSRGLTLVEILVMVFVLAVLASLLIPALLAAKKKATNINCTNHLMQIEVSFRIWEGDHNDKPPMEVSVTNGGAMEAAANGNAVTVFQVMSNELSTPKILFCPADDEHLGWPTNFTTDLKRKISYFVGLDAGTNQPQAFLSGDDNFAIAGQPVKPGLINLFSNSFVAWTTTRHPSGGNIAFADGSVQWVKNSNLVIGLGQSGLATNRLVIP